MYGFILFDRRVYSIMLASLKRVKLTDIAALVTAILYRVEIRRRGT